MRAENEAPLLGGAEDGFMPSNCVNSSDVSATHKQVLSFIDSTCLETFKPVRARRKAVLQPGSLVDSSKLLQRRQVLIPSKGFFGANQCVQAQHAARPEGERHGDAPLQHSVVTADARHLTETIDHTTIDQ